MNAELQRIARREKNTFLSDQCKEIEKNNRMGKTRDLFKKIEDIKGHHHIVNTEIRLIVFLQPKMEKLYTVSKNKT